MVFALLLLLLLLLLMPMLLLVTDAIRLSDMRSWKSSEASLLFLEFASICEERRKTFRLPYGRHNTLAKKGFRAISQKERESHNCSWAKQVRRNRWIVGGRRPSGRGCQFWSVRKLEIIQGKTRKKMGKDRNMTRINRNAET
jgi:hypothetical protein